MTLRFTLILLFGITSLAACSTTPSTSPQEPPRLESTQAQPHSLNQTEAQIASGGKRVAAHGTFGNGQPLPQARELPALEWACENREPKACLRVLAYYHEQDRTRFDEWLPKACSQSLIRCEVDKAVVPHGRAPLDPTLTQIATQTWSSEENGKVRTIHVEAFGAPSRKAEPKSAEPVSPLPKNPERRHRMR